jgi:hypothetical protein
VAHGVEGEGDVLAVQRVDARLCERRECAELELEALLLGSAEARVLQPLEMVHGRHSADRTHLARASSVTSVRIEGYERFQAVH